MVELLLEDYHLSKHAEDAIKLRDIRVSWINDTVLNHDKIVIISNKELHFYKKLLNKCLKVVVNPSSKKIVTIYFDRNMNKRGCK